jgi:hypothetical protein
VEQYFIDEGMLMPKFHKNYWMGLKTMEEDWPSFTTWVATSFCFDILQAGF